MTFERIYDEAEELFFSKSRDTTRVPMTLTIRGWPYRVKER